jgi:SAM-dependent methyltransferase
MLTVEERVVVDCYNCHSDDRVFFHRENGFEMVRCRGCGLLYVSERPDEELISESTAMGMHQGEKDLHVNVTYNRSVRLFYRKVIADIYQGKFSHIGSWLDVGCGHGEFIETLSEFAHETSITGSEPNVAKQNSAQQRGLDVGYFPLETHETKYDAVSLLNVYSHLSNPVEFIATLGNVLNTNGELLLQTGDVADLSADDMLKPLCLPDHLSFATEAIIRDILERQGFEIISVHKYPNLSLSPLQLTKEIVKFILPQRDSYLGYYASWKKHSKSRIFVRARYLG